MKVLLCIDDDSQYEAVLAAPKRFLGLDDDDEVLVAHAVATLRWLPLKGQDSGWAGTERAILERVDDFLERAADTLTRRGIAAKTLRLEGDVVSELLQAAHDHDVDVIVTGAIGQARGQDFLVGSVAEKFEALTQRDLLLVRADTDPSENMRAIVAIDDTPASFDAIERFANTFRVTSAAVEIVHVMQVPPPRLDAAPQRAAGDDDGASDTIPPVVRERAEHAVSRAEKLFSLRGVQPRLALRRGSPDREILAAAEAFHSDLIVVGRGGASIGARFVGWRGTVTKRVAHHATCSVFIAAASPSRRNKAPEGDYESEGSRTDGR